MFSNGFSEHMPFGTIGSRISCSSEILLFYCLPDCTKRFQSDDRLCNFGKQLCSYTTKVEMCQRGQFRESRPAEMGFQKKIPPLMCFLFMLSDNLMLKHNFHPFILCNSEIVLAGVNII